MPGPGEYRPDPTQGTTRVDDLPKTKVACQSRNYTAGDAAHAAATAPTAAASPAAPSTTGATPSPAGPAMQGKRILSHALNRAFSLYSSLAAHFSRLVSMPRRLLVSRLSSPSANRRITLRLAGA
jgi:hypothetical protein